MNSASLEQQLERLRAQKRALQNAELCRRLETPRTEEEMLLSFRRMKGLNVAEREALLSC